MHFRAPAIVCAVRPHGETAVIARLLIREQGMIAAYVAGGRGRHARPVLIPGNIVDAEINARAAGHLPWGRVELVQSRGPWLGEPLPAAAIAWITGLTAAVLPEHHAYPALHDGAAALLDAVCVAPSARDWVGPMVGYELLVLRELGYGGMAARPEASDWPGLLGAFDRAGVLIGRYLLADRLADVMGAREVLRQRLGRIGGQEPSGES